VVTHETDFLDLYRRLGIDPGCDLAELKQAYRRHVAILHPDRQPGRPVDPRAAARLQRLTAQYGAAMEFHRRHGRLPGAPREATVGEAVGSVGRPGAVQQAADPFAARRNRVPQNQAPHEASLLPRSRSRGKLVALLVIGALAVLGWTVHEASLPNTSDSADEDVPAQVDSVGVPHEAAATEAVLHVGMSTDDVRALEGEPVAMHGDLWEYGPSWVRFDHDEVVEWHSSPLRPLRTDTGVTTH
jgi:DnaJ domain